MRTFRVSISFDENKEQDIINWLESLSEKRQIGEVLSNMVKSAFDGDGTAFKNMNTTSLSVIRQQFFNEITQEVKAQTNKIDEVYSMCEDLYGLARLNKTVELEAKTDNLMLTQFVLQRQQNQLKQILGVDNVKVPYASDRLLDEKEKAEKVFGFIAEVYESYIAEIQKQVALLQNIQIQFNGEVVAAPQKPELLTTTTQAQDDDEYIDLIEKPADSHIVKKLTDNQAEELKDWLDDFD